MEGEAEDMVEVVVQVTMEADESGEYYMYIHTWPL
jgi:hypothetical protein